MGSLRWMVLKKLISSASPLGFIPPYYNESNSASSRGLQRGDLSGEVLFIGLTDRLTPHTTFLASCGWIWRCGLLGGKVKKAKNQGINCYSNMALFSPTTDSCGIKKNFHHWVPCLVMIQDVVVGTLVWLFWNVWFNLTTTKNSQWVALPGLLET